MSERVHHANTCSSVSKNRDWEVSGAFKFHSIGNLKHSPLPLSMASGYASVNGTITIDHKADIQ